MRPRVPRWSNGPTSSGTCGVDSASRWSLIVTTGVIAQRKGDGSTWDTLGGAPDPLVCITIAGERRCTGAVSDNFTPVWNSRFPATSASELLGGVRVEIIDEDAAADDDICSAGNELVTLTDFQSGGGDFGCPFATVFFTLRAAVVATTHRSCAGAAAPPGGSARHPRSERIRATAAIHSERCARGGGPPNVEARFSSRVRRRPPPTRINPSLEGR